MDKQRQPKALLRCNSPQSLKNAKNTILLSSFLNYGVNIIQSHTILGENIMDNRKFEQLIDLIINENEDQAKALFHDIVVEKSREIYESMMADEMDESAPMGQVGDLLDEISAEESGVVEGEDEGEFDIDDQEDVIDIDGGDEGEFDGEEAGMEDRLVSIEDKLDQLMAEFEDIMADEDGEEDMGDEEGSGEEDFGDEEDD